MARRGSKKRCSAKVRPGCQRPAASKGLCHGHYQMAQRLAERNEPLELRPLGKPVGPGRVRVYGSVPRWACKVLDAEARKRGLATRYALISAVLEEFTAERRQAA